MTEEELYKLYLDGLADEFKDYSNLDLVEGVIDNLSEVTLRVFQEEWDANEVVIFIETQIQKMVDLLRERLNGK